MNDLLNNNAFLIAFWAASSLFFFSLALLIYNRRLKKRLINSEAEAFRRGSNIVRLEDLLRKYDARHAGFVQSEVHQTIKLRQSEKRMQEIINAAGVEANRNILLTKLLTRVYPYSRLILTDNAKLEAHLHKLEDAAREREKRRKRRRPATA